MKFDSDIRQVVLVTGAARSGKSEWAETLAHNSNKSVTYVATAMMIPEDCQWQQRILQHQKRRPSSWQTIAEPKNITAVIRAQSDCCLLVDSVGSWVANWLNAEDTVWEGITNDLLACLKELRSSIIFVAEETGWGVIPAYASGRLFRDRLGHLTRQIGSMAHTTYLVTGGHVLNLSVLGTPLNSDE